MQKRFKFITLVFLLTTAACTHSGNSHSSPNQTTQNVELTISAAASLQDPLDVIRSTYEKERSDVKLKFNFGSSGSLQQQISQGAPVDLFFSAAEDQFAMLVSEGKIDKEDRVDLLQNELVLVAPKGKQAHVTSFQALNHDKVQKISIGTPATVPAGKYAKESLEKMAIWKDVESKMVYAKDVRQVLAYVETGNIDAGIVYKTDALTSSAAAIVTTADPKTHTPIIYPVGIIQDSEHYEAAKDFYNYLQSDDALKVFEEYGFIIP